MEVVARETVTVPAGTFPNCYKIREHMGPGTGYYECYRWYAPDVGPVMDSVSVAGGAALAKLRLFRVQP
jgi:hypothetical protein